MRIIIRGAVVAAATTLALGVAGTAFADPSQVQSKDSNTSSNANCIGYLSSSFTHNGSAGTLGEGGDPSHGTRGDEIKGYQSGDTACPTL